ncbi:MAG: hypothetical protein AB1792_04580 [Candidatus Zixiibacteriota bacterium]
MTPDDPARRRKLPLLALACVLALVGYVSAGDSSRVVTDDPRTWRVIPWWAIGGGYQQAEAGVPFGAATSYGSDSMECPLLAAFSVTQGDIAVHFDSSRKVTELYVGDYYNNRIVRHDVDSALRHDTIPLPATYRVAWLVEDVDRDGQLDLVGQTGNLVDGYLDFLSAPDWSLRQRFVFPGMNVGMDPVSVNLDSDAALELYLTVGSLGGTSRALVIDFNATADSFEIVSDIAAPPLTGGPSAVGDFDHDGRIEFIAGSESGYMLFEWKDGGLVYIGRVGETLAGNQHCASAVRPKPGGVLHVLLGYSFTEVPGGEYRYELLQPIGDNVFRVVQVFSEITGAVGWTPAFGFDVDCDGLDELTMFFSPYHKVWEWNTPQVAFVETCSWNEGDVGMLVYWYGVDFDQNGAQEWGTVNHRDEFQAFLGSGCENCDSSGRCIPPIPACYCACHGDPNCDGVRTDVQDVVNCVDVAFRGQGAQPDPGPLCSIKQTDADCDSFTTVIDVVKIINVAFRNADPTIEFCNPCVPITQGDAK